MYATWAGLLPLIEEQGDAPEHVSNDQVLLMAMFDPAFSNSVRTSLHNLHHVSSLVRDYMTLESWRIVTQVEENFTSFPADGRLHVGETLELLHQTIMILSAFNGLSSENMIRGPEWRFLDMGRRIERAYHTTSLLRHMLVQASELEAAVLEALLEVGDSAITYRTRYLSRLQCAPVVDLLLMDDTNPRAVIYQLVQLGNHVEQLPRERGMPALNPAERLTLQMLTHVRLAEINPLCQVSRSGSRVRLEALLTSLLTHLPALSDTITYHYLSHAEPPRHLAQMES
jgi:uncharacterized alpha-E superfamily protein